MRSAGMAGFVLGLRAVLGVVPVALRAIAAIVFGAALLIGSTAMPHPSMTLAGYGTPSGLVHEAIAASVGAQVLVGLASIALGIIAVVGIHTTVVTLVALLTLGSAVLLSGTAIGATVMSAFRRHV